MKRCVIVLSAVAISTLVLAVSLSARQLDKPVDESIRPLQVHQPEARDSSSLLEADIARRKVVAYYFHTTVRCASCRKIESYSEQAIRTSFATELEKGSLEWRPINTDESVNKHFIKDFQLITKSLVLVLLEDDKQIRWKNLDRVWILLRNKPSFLEYVRNEVAAFLNEP